MKLSFIVVAETQAEGYRSAGIGKTPLPGTGASAAGRDEGKRAVFGGPGRDNRPGHR